MKVIGLIGGMSWQSTATYYSELNRMARSRLGGLHSAKILLWSFDFAEVEALQAAGNWETATTVMIKAAQALERGGADCIAICTNTMHMMYEQVQAVVSIPLIHIADGAASAIKAAGCNKPLLLATKHTMEKDFYRGRLVSEHGVDAMVPNEDDRDYVHQIIYGELCAGKILSASKTCYLDIAEKAFKVGADSIIFGCTEIGLLVSADDFDRPAFDTTKLHCEALMDFALQED